MESQEFKGGGGVLAHKSREGRMTGKSGGLIILYALDISYAIHKSKFNYTNTYSFRQENVQP